MTRANQPAFPDDGCGAGLTIREHLASLAMQGLSANSAGYSPAQTAEMAVNRADALLAALAEKPTPGEWDAMREVCRLIADLDLCEGYTLADAELPKLWTALSLARDAMKGGG